MPLYLCRSVSQDYFLCGCVQKRCNPGQVAVHYGGGPFFEVTVCSQGYAQPEGHLFLCESASLAYLTDIVLDGNVVKTESVNSSLNNNYVVSVSGSEDDSELAVYINDALLYEATVDFTREPAKFTKERTYEVAFYADVVGLSEIEAVNTLNSLGYTNVTVKYEESFEQEGTVIYQSPAYSTAPNLDKTANIVLTICKKGVTEPNQPTIPEESSTEEQTELQVQ